MSANPYYPVTTSSDSAHLTDDDWGLSFSSNKRASVSRFKSLCQKVQERPKCVLSVFIAVFIFLLICIIIAVAAARDSPRKHPTGNEAKRIFQTTGLNFYPIPEDGTILISFVPKILQNDDAIKHTMDDAVKPYQMTEQLSPEFVDCNATHAPFNKSCHYTRDHFGDHCTSHSGYGFPTGQPCVLIQMELPNDKTIRPIPPNSKLIEGRTPPTSDNPSSIPISCAGSTSDDQKLLDALRNHGTFEYYPPSGFPAYLYRPRNTSLPFVKPGVMIRIPDLPNRHVVHITCTAWGQLYKADGSMINHNLLQTTFAFYLQFGSE